MPAHVGFVAARSAWLRDKIRKAREKQEAQALVDVSAMSLLYLERTFVDSEPKATGVCALVP